MCNHPTSTYLRGKGAQRTSSLYTGTPALYIAIMLANVLDKPKTATTPSKVDIESRGSDRTTRAGCSCCSRKRAPAGQACSVPSATKEEERDTTTTGECYLCYDSKRDDPEPLVRGVCACKHTAMHLACQRRMIEMAEEAGKPNPMQCSVCQVKFSNAEVAVGRLRLTRPGAISLLLVAGFLVLLACIIAALWPREREGEGWWDRATGSTEDAPSHGADPLLNFFALLTLRLTLIGACGIGLWAVMTWLAMSLSSGTFGEARQRPDAAGLGLFLQPTFCRARETRVWQPAAA